MLKQHREGSKNDNLREKSRNAFESEMHKRLNKTDQGMLKRGERPNKWIGNSFGAA